MASKTVEQKIREQRQQRSESQSAADVLSELSEQQDTLRGSEIIAAVADHLGTQKIARMIAVNIEKGSPKDSKMFLQELMRMINTNEKKTAAITESELSRLEDDQIDALLNAEFGLMRKEHDSGDCFEEEVGESEEEVREQERP